MDVNSSIKCTIDNCKFHSNGKDYCTLQQIQIGTHEANPTMVECTDCKSFVLK